MAKFYGSVYESLVIIAYRSSEFSDKTAARFYGSVYESLVLIAYRSSEVSDEIVARFYGSVYESLVLSHMQVVKSQTRLRPDFIGQFMRVWYL